MGEKGRQRKPTAWFPALRAGTRSPSTPGPKDSPCHEGAVLSSGLKPASKTGAFQGSFSKAPDPLRIELFYNYFDIY